MIVLIRGVRYETVREAADALGVTTGWIYNSVRMGKQDLVGVGIGRRSTGVFEGNRFEIYGLTFASMKEASLALGFGPNYMRTAVRRASPRTMEKIKFAAMVYANRMESKNGTSDFGCDGSDLGDGLGGVGGGR